MSSNDCELGGAPIDDTLYKKIKTAIDVMDIIKSGGYTIGEAFLKTQCVAVDGGDDSIGKKDTMPSEYECQDPDAVRDDNNFVDHLFDKRYSVEVCDAVKDLLSLFHSMPNKGWCNKRCYKSDSTSECVLFEGTEHELNIVQLCDFFKHFNVIFTNDLLSVDATFGDVLEQQTKTDPSIRSGRMIGPDKWTASEAMLQQVKDLWCQNMSESNIDIQHYKINLYMKGDKFKQHKDTPDTNMIGTVVLTAFDNTQYWSGLHIGGNSAMKHKVCMKDGEVTTISSHYDIGTHPISMFYSDVVHEVIKCDASRVTLTFKVFATKEEDVSKLCFNHTYYKLKKKIDFLLCMSKVRKVGFLLNHEYSKDSTMLKGIDRHFTRALFERYKTTLLPVTISYDVELDDDEEEDTELQTITVGSIERVPFDDIPFIGLQGGNEIEYQYEPYVAFTGNESRSGHVNSVYLYKALIIEPSTNMPRDALILSCMNIDQKWGFNWNTETPLQDWERTYFDADGKLLYLFLGEMGLQAVPTELEQLCNLEVLNVSNNLLTAFDLDLRQLVNIEELYLFGNDIATSGFTDVFDETDYALPLRILAVAQNPIADDDDLWTEIHEMHDIDVLVKCDQLPPPSMKTFPPIVTPVKRKCQEGSEMEKKK